MKYFFLAALACFISCTPKSQAIEFTVEGKLTNSRASRIYLEVNSVEADPVIVDSTDLQPDGSFSLKAAAREESLYTLRLDRQIYPFAKLVNDSRKITIADDMSGNDIYRVSGSPASESLVRFDTAANRRAQEIYLAGRIVDSVEQAGSPDSIRGYYASNFYSLVTDFKQFTLEMISRSESPVVVAYIFSVYQGMNNQMNLPGFSHSESWQLMAQAAKRFPGHSMIEKISSQYAPRPAPDITMPDTAGNPVALSSFRGRYVLVDFWASWCAPCRNENPNLVAAYNRFKDKNFTILGVSLDRAREPWLRAIRDDSLAWTHISDLKYWNSAAVDLYGFNAIPYNVLIDPGGNIIAEQLTGENLHRVLGEVLK